MKLYVGLSQRCWIGLFVTLCLVVGSVDAECASNCTWNAWQDPSQCSQQCGPRGVSVIVRDGVEGEDCKCLEEDSFRMVPCNRICLNGGNVETVSGEDVCVCKTGFHGECCEHGYDLTLFVLVYLVIIGLCFGFVACMFCVGEYRHKNVLQAIPTTYETEFDDWEEEKPLLEPKFVWTEPHESRKVGAFQRSWDTYSEFSSRAGSAMSHGSIVEEIDPVTGAKVFKGRDEVLARLDIFEVGMLRSFHMLDRKTQCMLVHKLAPRLNFEEQIMLRSFHTLSEDENAKMVVLLNELAEKAQAVQGQEAAVQKELEENLAKEFDKIDDEVIDMMGRFEELTAEEREMVVEQMGGVLSEKEKAKLKNFDNLSAREKEVLREGKITAIQSVAKKVEMQALEENLSKEFEKIDEEVIDMMGRFEELTSEEREMVVEQMGGVLSEKEKEKLKKFDQLSEKEKVALREGKISKIQTVAKKVEVQEMENKMADKIDKIDTKVLQMMDKFDELTKEEREHVIKEMGGVLSEKDKKKLEQFDELSDKEKEALKEGKLKKIKTAATNVVVKKKFAGDIELATSAAQEGVISHASLRTAVTSKAVEKILATVAMAVGALAFRPDSRLDIRTRIIAKLTEMPESAVLELCELDEMDPEQMSLMGNEDRIKYLADRASCACVCDVNKLEETIAAEKAKAEEEARKQRELMGIGTPMSSMSGVMSMSSDEDEDGTGRPARKKAPVDLSKIQWAGPPKGAKPAFNRGGLSIGVLSTSVKKFKEREKIGTVQGRANLRASYLSEKLVKSLSHHSHDDVDANLKQSLRQRLSMPTNEEFGDVPIRFNR